jgi:hypothetical protein
MEYLRIELKQGTPLDAFYPRIKNKFNWTAFGTSVQAIQLDTNVITGTKEEDGDYIYVLPIADKTQALKAQKHLLTFKVVKTVTILTEEQAIEEKRIITEFKKSQKV